MTLQHFDFKMINFAMSPISRVKHWLSSACIFEIDMSLISQVISVVYIFPVLCQACARWLCRPLSPRPLWQATSLTQLEYILFCTTLILKWKVWIGSNFEPVHRYCVFAIPAHPAIPLLRCCTANIHTRPYQHNLATLIRIICLLTRLNRYNDS